MVMRFLRGPAQVDVSGGVRIKQESVHLLTEYVLSLSMSARADNDITPLYEKYIVRGDLLLLPADALGACMAVRTDADGYGWQVQRVSATCQP